MAADTYTAGATHSYAHINQGGPDSQQRRLRWYALVATHVFGLQLGWESLLRTSVCLSGRSNRYSYNVTDVITEMTPNMTWRSIRCATAMEDRD